MVATDTVRPQGMRAPDMFTVDPQVSRLEEYDVVGSGASAGERSRPELSWLGEL
jgi:hypothetical protein